jgi:hypothetical protein
MLKKLQKCAEIWKSLLNWENKTSNMFIMGPCLCIYKLIKKRDRATHKMLRITYGQGNINLFKCFTTKYLFKNCYIKIIFIYWSYKTSDLSSNIIQGLNLIIDNPLEFGKIYPHSHHQHLVLDVVSLVW